MFVDRVQVKVEAGTGGSGQTSFRRRSTCPWAGPTAVMADAVAT